MLKKAATISLATFFAHVTTWEGHIFHKPAEWLKERLPEGVQKPLFACPICMTPYWGTLMLLLLKGDRRGLARAVVTIAAAAGISAVMVMLSKAYSVLLLVEEEKEAGAMDRITRDEVAEMIAPLEKKLAEYTEQQALGPYAGIEISGEVKEREDTGLVTRKEVDERFAALEKKLAEATIPEGTRRDLEHIVSQNRVYKSMNKPGK